MTIKKIALITINRAVGPKIQEQVGFKKEEETNLLLYSLPSGAAYNGAFKYIEINEMLYSSHIRIDEKDEGFGAVIAVPLESIRFNPFSLNPILEKMVEDQKLVDHIDIDELIANQKTRDPINLSGSTYVIGSLILAQRVIIVGTHKEVINFLTNIYDGVPHESVTSLVTLTYSKNLSNSYTMIGVPNNESLFEEIENAQKDSTIIFLEQKKAFGLFRSPFTDRIEQLYFKGKYDVIRREITEFLELSLKEKIESSSDFAMKYNLKRADAKLLKLYQKRQVELLKIREKYPVYRRLRL